MTSQLNKTFDVNKVTVGGSNEPYFIAEAGSNFDQDLDTGLKLIDIAADAGANAVKFQLFRADALYPDGGELHAAFKAVELNPDWVPQLAEHAASQGLTFLASAFVADSVVADVASLASFLVHPKAVTIAAAMSREWGRIVVLLVGETLRPEHQGTQASLREGYTQSCDLVLI